MASDSVKSNRPNSPPPAAKSAAGPNWATRYGERHRLRRIADLPAEIVLPQRVRLYARRGHYVLQWWDPGGKKNASLRVEGDLIAAITKAREIEERLTHFKSAGPGRPRLKHAEMVDAFLADLDRRADAGEIDPGTGGRYRAALGHFLAFVAQPEIATGFPYAAGVNRDFRLELSGFLNQRQVAANGSSQAAVRPMRGQAFVESTIHAMFAWAADPQRGNLLPTGFRSPFQRSRRTAPGAAADPVGEPDITLQMACDFIASCDAWQLALFVPMMLYGLRPAEPCFVFREHVDADWFRVPCIPELGYWTKGRRNKQLPLVGPVQAALAVLNHTTKQGLLFRRRGIVSGKDQSPLAGVSLVDLTRTYQSRCGQAQLGATGRRNLRDDLLHEAGAVGYDHVQGEFQRLARRLNWPPQATAKDFRHLCATALENAGMPEFYRRYLLGQSPGRSAIVTYTHLNRLREQYERAITGELVPVANAVVRRYHELSEGAAKASAPAVEP